MSFNRADYERTFAFAALVYTKSLDKQIKRAAVEVMASVEHVVGQLHVSSDKFADPLGAANVETLRLALGACHFALLDALVAMLGDKHGGALATLANDSLLEFARHTDDAATRELLALIASCVDERLDLERIGAPRPSSTAG